MSNFTDLIGSAGGKPKRVTTLTSGTGTFTPLVAMGRYRVLLQGGGAGSNGLGGGAGAYLPFDGIFITIAGVMYAVGAAGTAGLAGGATTFGTLSAPGAPTPAGNPTAGGRIVATMGIDGGDCGKGPGNIVIPGATIYEGGSSPLGKGGVGGGAAATGYGAGGAPTVVGGGPDRPGSPGAIIIIEYGV